MKYSIENLKAKFLSLGGKITKYGYSTPDLDIEGCSAYESAIISQMASLGDKYFSKTQNSPEDLEALSSEYEQERASLEAELDKYYKNHPDYELLLIENVLKNMDNATSLGIAIGDTISTAELTETFIELGGSVDYNNETTNQPVYEFPEKPKAIVELEDKIAKLDEEIELLESPTTQTPPEAKQVLINAKIGKVLDLRRDLDQEIENHPEYAKANAVLKSIQAVSELDDYMSRQNIMV